MRIIDALSLLGVVLVLVLLLHGARHGPIKPVLRALALEEPVPTASVTDSASASSSSSSSAASAEGHATQPRTDRSAQAASRPAATVAVRESR